MITKEDVTKALSELNLSEEVSKGDLGPANGAADEAGSLGVDGDDMEKEGKGKGKEKKEKDTEKSFYEELPAEVEAKVEVSNFLKSLVDYTASQIDSLKDRVVKSDSAQAVRYEETMEVLDGISKSMGHVGIVLKAMCERIGILENQPEQPKAITKSMDAPVERQFVGMGSSETGGMFKSLDGKTPFEVKKSISDAMFELVKKDEMSDTDLINFETFGYVTPEAGRLLNKIL